MRLSSLVLAGTFIFGTMHFAHAAPWVDTQDAYLYQSIQQLANAGFITTPVNTVPIMWNPIIQDLANIDVNRLNQAQKHAFYRVQAAAGFARQSNIKHLAVKATNAPVQKTGFGAEYLQKAQLSLGTELTEGNWSVGLYKQFNRDSFINSAHSETNPLNENKTSWNNSFAAYTAGNWVISASTQPQWWGPSIGQSFNQNANQQPPRMIQLNRLNPNAPFSKHLAWLGPTSVNVQYGYHASTDMLRHASFLATRVGIKPHNKLELAISQRAISPKATEQQLDFSPKTEDNINNFGFDVSFNLTPVTNLYAELSQQTSNSTYASANSWMVGGRYHLANEHAMLRFFVEHQQQQAAYFTWQNIQQQAASDLSNKQWQAGVHISTPSGRAGYLYLTQRQFDETATIAKQALYTISNPHLTQARNALNLGYQHPVGYGLLQIDLQLTKQHNKQLSSNTQQHTYEHSTGVRWEWRW